MYINMIRAVPSLHRVPGKPRERSVLPGNIGKGIFEDITFFFFFPHHVTCGILVPD